MSKIAVFGGGSWGTAFSTVLADAGNDVTIWARRQELADQISAGRNDDYLPGLELSSSISGTTDPAEAVEGADIVVLSVPSQSLRDNLAGWGDVLGDRIIVSLMKGVELGTTKRMSEVIAEAGGVPTERIAVVSGPNLAKEIVQRQPAATVIACPEESAADRAQRADLGLTYRNECVSVDLSVSRRFTASDNLRADTDVGLSVRLGGFGRQRDTGPGTVARRSCLR